MLDDNWQHEFDVVDDFRPLESNTRLQDHEADLFEGALRTVGMNCRDGAGMTGVDGAQKRIGLHPTDFAEEETVGPQTHGGLQQGFNRHTCFTLVTLRGHKRQEVLLHRIEFPRVFNGENALIRPHFLQNGIEESGLAG